MGSRTHIAILGGSWLLCLFLSLSIARPTPAATLQVPGGFARIQAAVDAANPGDVISVAAGTYRERVRLKAGVTLRSAGDDASGKLGLARAEATVIDGGGADEKSAGVEMAEGAVLDGFTVAHVGRYDEQAWNHHFATRGNEQPHEHIGAPGVAGVSVLGVTCEVRNNIVRHNGHTGIAITGVAEQKCAPLVVNNVTWRNMGGGIGSMNGSTAIIRSNACFENFFAGIGHENASPLVESNRCFGNIRAGIGVSEGASPTVRFNHCHDNRRAGIGIRTGASTRPLVERNDCHDNGMAGIGVEEEARPVVRANRCFRNTLAGIGVRDHARPDIIGNECLENGAAGIGLMSGHGTLVTSNHCHHNRAAGIGLDAGPTNSVMLTGNRILDNAQVALGIHPGWSVVASGNEFSRAGGLPPIIMVFAGASAAFTNNVIRGGGVAGIRVAGRVIATDNHFEGTGLRKAGPPNFAVWALPGAHVELVGNHIDSWRHALFADGAEASARLNSVTNAFGSAFRIRQPARPPVVSDNSVASPGVKELVIEP